MSNVKRRQSGFTLLETITAFFITVVSLGVVFEIYMKGVTSAVLASEYASALSIAESRLAEISNDAAMRNLEDEGTEEGRYDWKVRVTDYLVANPGNGAQTSYSLVQVGVSVSWRSQGKSHGIDLRTLKPIILE